MRKKNCVKWGILCVCLLSVIGISSLDKLENKMKQSEPVSMEKLIEAQGNDSLSAISQSEKIRQYNKYAAEIEMLPNGYFKGIETINYVHEFKQSTDKLLIKLNLNSSMKKTQGIEESNIYITDVIVNGEKVSFAQEYTDLWIDLGKPVIEEEELNISLAFDGHLIDDLRDPGEERVGWQGSFLPKMGVFEEYKGWNNTYDYNTTPYDYSETSDYRVSFITKETKVPIMTGTLVEEEKIEGNLYKYVYEAKKIRDVGVYYGNKMNDYVVQTTSGSTVHIYSYRSLDVGVIGARINEIFNYYTSILGRYPYDVFKIIDIKGLKNTTTYSGMLITDLNEASVRYEEMYEGIGRQWIPYILQFHPVEDKWFLEGLSSYIFKRGTTSLEGIQRYLDLIKIGDSKNSIDEEKVLRHFKCFYDIESVLGTEEWIEFLKSYYKQNALKVLDSQTFIKMLLEGSGQELNHLVNVYSKQSDREDGTQ